jgi:hypothetical protein
MSVIAVFPLKTGDPMFVGFNSQNISHSFPHYPNWNLWVWEISPIGFREVQRISREYNCVICVKRCEISRETWVTT